MPVQKMLSIHVTDLCNNHCIFCIVDSPYQKMEQVSSERIFEFLEKHQGQGYEAVNIHGGEATIRKDFLIILEKIKEYGYPRVILQTNARRLADLNFTRQTVNLGVDLFVVSIHGNNPQIHDGITKVPGSLDQAVQGIRNIKSLGAKVRTNTVASRLNSRFLPMIMEFLLNLEVDHINISAVHTAGAAYRNFEAVTPTFEEIRPIIKESVELVNRSKIRLTLEGFPFCCIPGMEELVVDWDNQKFKMLFRTFVLDDYERYMDRNMRVQGEPCLTCHQNNKCGGVYKEYIQLRGWDEFGYSPVEKKKETAFAK
jgi:MoaA/NifB/PqqE/SkfB family radical SAM enzyme